MSNSMRLTESDYQIIKQQLGREPRGITAIPSRTAAGLPIVLQMRTWIDGAPFPTLYWLSSRDVHKAISRIEAAGVVKTLEAEIANDNELQSEIAADHQRYVDLRAQHAIAADTQAMQQAGLAEAFSHLGVGGIQNWHKVRCLHMHYAFHLATLAQGGTVIGRMLDSQYALSELDILN